MTPINWREITPEQARRLIGPASRAERIANGKAQATQADDDIEAAIAAYMRWENLTVFVATGERPAN